jgi:hypothetical protein
MGPAFERGNQYLVDPTTVMDLFGGATQNGIQRPGKINNKLIYVGKEDEYTPLFKKNQFGNKKRTSKIGEGSVLTVKNNKIKVS